MVDIKDVKVQLAALKQVSKKAKEKGWTANKIDGHVEARVLKNNVLEIVLLDKSKNRHFLRANAKGDVYFAPVTLTCF